MPDDWQPVKLAAKVIGHISQGMYRTPAGAIKELISNAYDAGATRVKIHTGFPKFAAFSCEDNGSGMSKDKFIQLMDGGIGDSDKRAIEGQTGVNGRPVIGRLGVGLLSLAQLCPRFFIRSFHPDTKTAFEAEIKFPAYSRQEIDTAMQALKDQPAIPLKHGEYKVVDLEYEQGRRGIIVTTRFLRDGFRKSMSGLQSFAHQQFRRSTQSYPSFEAFLQCIANPKLSSLYFASQYDQLLFGIALASPIPYMETASKNAGVETIVTRIPQIAAIQKDLKRFDFRVEVDNIELRRPVVLPSNKDCIRAVDCNVPSSPKKLPLTVTDGVYTEDVVVDKYDISVKGREETFQLYAFEYSAEVNGYPLHFSGYIFVQTSRLFPKEYQGLLVRLRHVAIGQYDVNVMTYPFAEGPRFSMLSSEIFVMAGLDDALKVDRDGFNTLDPQYIRLQAFVHSILHELIFPGQWEEEKTRNKHKRVVLERQVTSTFAKRLRDTTDRTFSKVEVIPRKTGQSAAPAPVQLDKASGTIRINESNPEAKAILGRKRYHGIAARVIAAFEVANQENSAAKRREVFYRLIEDVFQ